MFCSFIATSRSTSAHRSSILTVIWRNTVCLYAPFHWPVGRVRNM
jgi:hypothetical protein